MKSRLLAALAALLVSVAPAFAARTDLTVQTPVNLNSSISADAADLASTAGDASNGNQFVMSGGEIIIAKNSGASARTITITSAPDNLGRTKDITTYSIGAGETAIFGPFQAYGWRQSNGKGYIDVSNAEVLLSVYRAQ